MASYAGGYSQQRIFSNTTSRPRWQHQSTKRNLEKICHDGDDTPDADNDDVLLGIKEIPSPQSRTSNEDSEAWKHGKDDYEPPFPGY